MQKKTKAVHWSDPSSDEAAEDCVTAKGGTERHQAGACSLLPLLGLGETVLTLRVLHQVALADEFVDDDL